MFISLKAEMLARMQIAIALYSILINNSVKGKIKSRNPQTLFSLL